MRLILPAAVLALFAIQLPSGSEPLLLVQSIDLPEPWSLSGVAGKRLFV
ncbi:MAG TPA: hypothetical protein VGI56_15145 [Galbitalea sp.]|jgi:hypothetical protein